jgi:hypothetical protein
MHRGSPALPDPSQTKSTITLIFLYHLQLPHAAMLPMFISHLIHHLRPKNIYVLTASRYFQPPFVVCAPYPKRKETSTLGDFDALNSAAAIAAASQTPLRACRSRPLVHPSRPPPPPAAPYLRLCARRTRRHPTGSPQPRPKRRRQVSHFLLSAI